MFQKKLPEENQRSNNLMFYYQNIRGINTKLDVFNQNITLVDYDIIVLSETWLNNEVNDSELGLLSKYTIFRCDRGSIIGNNIRGGCVLIAIKSHFHRCQLNLQNNNIEQLFINLSLGSFTLVIGAVYIPPHSNVNTYNDHTNTVNNLLNQHSNANIILFGDYNLLCIQWSLVNNKIVPHLSQFNKLSGTTLANFSYLNLKQFNLVKNNNSILDLILSNYNNIEVYKEQFSLLPIDYLYHPALVFNQF